MASGRSQFGTLTRRSFYSKGGPVRIKKNKGCGKIMSNRGLTPHRSKDTKNPRVRLKNKFAKAVVRRKGKVRDMKVGATTYGGEETGVKTSVIKSRKL